MRKEVESGIEYVENSEDIVDVGNMANTEDFEGFWDDAVCEPNAYAASYEQGKYTIEDYFALPDDDRKELIDGVFYDMAAPIHIHQYLCTRITIMLGNYISKKGGSCIPFGSPVDVQLDCDDKTIVQPDVFVLCDREKFQKGRVIGAPDFVIEILSPSTKKKDQTLKRYKYRNAGVKEYWIVNPKKRTVVVYYFEKETFARLYTFDDKVPVNLFGEDCVIDFQEIYRNMEFLYDRL